MLTGRSSVTPFGRYDAAIVRLYERRLFALALMMTRDAAAAEEVAQVRASAEDLAGYYADVEPVLAGFLGSLDEAALDRVVDEAYDPPVTLGVRMVSIVDDMVQHIAQAAYVRGMLDRR